MPVAPEPSDIPPPVPDEDAAGPAQAVARETPCIQTLPDEIRDGYEVHEWRHACAVLRNDFPAEYADIIDVLRGFRLKRSHILVPGGSKSKVASAIDGAFFGKNPPWEEKQFNTKIVVSSSEVLSATFANPAFEVL